MGAATHRSIRLDRGTFSDRVGRGLVPLLGLADQTGLAEIITGLA